MSEHDSNYEIESTSNLTSSKYIEQPVTTPSIKNIEGVGDIPFQSEGFTFNHTMLRVKNPTKSLAFYTQVLGMTLLHVKSFPKMSFDLYFLAKLTIEERTTTKY